MKKTEFYIEKSADFCNAVAAIAVVGMMSVTALDVAMRFFSISLPGAYDVVSLLGAVVVAFALTYTSIQRGHIAVDFVYQKVPESYRPFFDIFNELAGCVFFALLAWQCFVYSAALKSAGEVSLTIQIPMYPFVAGIGLNCVLLSLYLLLNLVRAFKGVLKQ
jgi:TRAP-type C4-dicarboxylate transport system permease small subunit